MGVSGKEVPGGCEGKEAHSLFLAFKDVRSVLLLLVYGLFPFLSACDSPICLLDPQIERALKLQQSHLFSDTTKKTSIFLLIKLETESSRRTNNIYFLDLVSLEILKKYLEIIKKYSASICLPEC